MRSQRLFSWLVACATVLLVMLIAVSPTMAGQQDYSYQETLEHTVTGTAPQLQMQAVVVPQAVAPAPVATYGYYAPAVYSLNTMALLDTGSRRSRTTVETKTTTVDRGPRLRDRLRARRHANVYVGVAAAPVGVAYVPNECDGLELQE